MVKCIIIVISLSGQILEKVGLFNSCESASFYASKLEEEVVLIDSVELGGCKSILYQDENICNLSDSIF